jgi:RHH-type rel operon transcriptional repressor/antitoxin RelB
VNSKRKYVIVRTVVFTLLGFFMATVNIRIDDKLKADSFKALEELGVSPSELLRQTLEYVANNQKLPFKSILMTDEDEALIQLVKERLKEPREVKVSLDEL